MKPVPRPRLKLPQLLGAALIIAGCLFMVVTVAIHAIRDNRHAAEPVGSAMFAPDLTTNQEPLATFPRTFLGFRFGDSYEQVARTCRASGHTLGALERQGEYASARCDGVPSPERGLQGDSVDVSFCPLRGAPGARVCEITLHVDDQPAKGYREALGALTAKYGKPAEMIATAPADEEAAIRTCAGDGTIASASWRWSTGLDGSIDTSLHCLDKHPWTWVSAMDPDGTARYRDPR